MKRFVTFAILATAMYIAAVSISLAYSSGLVAPSGSSKAVIVTTASTANSSTVTSTTTVTAVAGSTITVTMPNATPTTAYGAFVTFYDVNGKPIDSVTVDEPLYSDGTDCGTWVCPN